MRLLQKKYNSNKTITNQEAQEYNGVTIETNPIIENSEGIDWQAKYYETILSDNILVYNPSASFLVHIILF